MQFVKKLEGYCFEKYVLDVCIATIERGRSTSKLDTFCFVSTIEAWGVQKHTQLVTFLHLSHTIRC